MLHRRGDLVVAQRLGGAGSGVALLGTGGRQRRALDDLPLVAMVALARVHARHQPLHLRRHTRVRLRPERLVPALHPVVHPRRRVCAIGNCAASVERC